ncbi:unnamed protein product [Symbiodinium sp. CCMP2456]|nr:unnamed protein product [Symbiodinium sp. CCMP2456]
MQSVIKDGEINLTTTKKSRTSSYEQLSLKKSGESKADNILRRGIPITNGNPSTTQCTHCSHELMQNITVRWVVQRGVDFQIHRKDCKVVPMQSHKFLCPACALDLAAQSFSMVQMAPYQDGCTSAGASFTRFHSCLAMHCPTTVVEICPESFKTGRSQMVFRNHLDFDRFTSQFEVLHSLAAETGDISKPNTPSVSSNCFSRLGLV